MRPWFAAGILLDQVGATFRVCLQRNCQSHRHVGGVAFAMATIPDDRVQQLDASRSRPGIAEMQPLATAPKPCCELDLKVRPVLERRDVSPYRADPHRLPQQISSILCTSSSLAAQSQPRH